MKKLTVTGASGFIGRNLCEFFRLRDIHVTSLNLREGVPQHLSPADALIHLAGKAHDLKNTSLPQEYFKINYELTKNLFDTYLQSTIKDFFYFSSIKAVADYTEEVLNEDTVPSPQTPYGQSKLQAEQYILKQSIPDGKRVFIIRPCLTHGPGNKGNLTSLYQIIKKGIPYPLAAFKNERSFLSIGNLNFMVLGMLDNKKLPSGVYNFADDERVSTNNLIRIIGKTIEKKIKLWPLPKSLILMTAKIGDVLHLPLNSDRLRKMTTSYIVSNEKIKHALGIKKLPITAQDGLIHTIKSFEKR